MTGVEIIQTIMSNNEWSLMDIYEKLEGTVAYPTLQKAINGERFEDMSVGNLVTYANALGYKVIADPRRDWETDEEDYEVTLNAD